LAGRLREGYACACAPASADRHGRAGGGIGRSLAVGRQTPSAMWICPWVRALVAAPPPPSS